MGLFLEFLISSKNMKFLLQINRERGKFGVKFYIPQTGRQEKEGERDVWEKIEAKYEDELTKWRKAGTELFAERGRVPASFEVFSQAARARPSKDVQVAGGRRCSRQVRGLLRERSLSVYKETRARCGESGALRAPTSPPASPAPRNRPLLLLCLPYIIDFLQITLRIRS